MRLANALKSQGWGSESSAPPAIRLMLALCLCVATTPVRGQAGPQPREPVRVVLGEDTMIPGYQVTIMCELEAPESTPVGRLELEVTFPAAKVSFDGVRRGLISDQVDALITPAVQQGSEPGSTTLTVSFAPKEKVAIPQGFLFDLVFNISKEMSTNDPPVVLKNIARAYGLSDGTQPLPGVESKDGLIRVVAEPPPIASCFFYMH